MKSFSDWTREIATANQAKVTGKESENWDITPVRGHCIHEMFVPGLNKDLIECPCGLMFTGAQMVAMPEAARNAYIARTWTAPTPGLYPDDVGLFFNGKTFEWYAFCRKCGSDYVVEEPLLFDPDMAYGNCGPGCQP